MMPRQITVALDGSSFAERAIPIAQAVARQLGASMQFLVAKSDEDPDIARAYLTRTAQEYGTSDANFVPDREARDALVLAAEDPAGIVCATSHGRGKLRSMRETLARTASFGCSVHSTSG
jgi:nucleotide-binding universal stress UspA family protein